MKENDEDLRKKTERVRERERELNFALVSFCSLKKKTDFILCGCVFYTT
ncbi:hypothetical protein LOK49_LG15G02653 [Camellia lanceoleosa]|uniref:Uncharacterized protein n=1 Tax=Camellia lanceoleosa TaxID=1840588 RepID=A0ACC0F8G9_9ERIC|nr:hypothetical protein LOK49_LG15G02653 [Camellia lanceoleosa]